MLVPLLATRQVQDLHVISISYLPIVTVASVFMPKCMCVRACMRVFARVCESVSVCLYVCACVHRMCVRDNP